MAINFLDTLLFKLNNSMEEATAFIDSFNADGTFLDFYPASTSKQAKELLPVCIPSFRSKLKLGIYDYMGHNLTVFIKESDAKAFCLLMDIPYEYLARVTVLNAQTNERLLPLISFTYNKKDFNYFSLREELCRILKTVPIRATVNEPTHQTEAGAA